MILFGFGKRDETVAEPPRVASVVISEAGLVRTENEDHVFIDDSRLVYGVADGMGGGAAGALASEAVCRNLKMYLQASADTMASRVAAVGRAVEEANAFIWSLAKEQGYAAMGTTVAVLVLDPANLRHVAVCHVGDSRIYRIRRGMPMRLTNDHRVAAGDNTLTKAVGVRPSVAPEWLEVDGHAPSRYVLCTDGVHDLVSEGRLAAFVAPGDLRAAAGRLKAEVLRRGAPDNFSFILIDA